MTVTFHRLVPRDVSAILRQYDEGSRSAGDEFFRELQEALSAAANHPKRAHLGEQGLRRVNLKSFPYHFLYEILPGRIRVIVVKHHRRHPRFGLRRHGSKSLV